MTEKLEKPSSKILVVEDNEATAAAYEHFAYRAGNEVEVAFSSEEAIDLLSKGDYDLIVTDGLRGKWKEVYNEGLESGTKTVVISGEEQIVREAKEMGAESLLKDAKPESIKGVKAIFSL